MFNNIELGNKPTTKLKHITVSERNYFALKKLGTAGDSFNDVVTEVLRQVGGQKTNE